MSKIARKTQKILGGSASNNGVFGSAQAGTFLTSTDPATIQSLSAWANGWNSAVVSGLQLPTLEEMQGIQYVQTYQLAYLFQEGIPEWDAGTTYYQNSIVKKAGTYQIYGSLTDNNLNHALTDGANWTLLQDLSAPLTNGNKGDITLSGTPAGSTFTINSSAVSNSKLADMVASTIKGRSGTTGAPQDLTLGSGLSISGGILLNTSPGMINKVLFTSSTTWVVPAGITKLFVQATGAGAGGGGATSGGQGTGGGGGALGWDIVTVTSGETLTITIGAAGSAGSSAGGDATDGGDTTISGSFGTLTAGGGKKGVGSTGLNNKTGGLGGTYSGFTYGINGEPGMNGQAVSGFNNGFSNPAGGSSPSGGAGGWGGDCNGGTSPHLAGYDGIEPGGAGGGANYGAATGGAGSKGRVWFVY